MVCLEIARPNHLIARPGGAGAGPKERAKWGAVGAPAGVEGYLIARNKKHFGQAKGALPAAPAPPAIRAMRGDA